MSDYLVNKIFAMKPHMNYKTDNTDFVKKGNDNYIFIHKIKGAYPEIRKASFQFNVVSKSISKLLISHKNYRNKTCLQQQ